MTDHVLIRIRGVQISREDAEPQEPIETIVAGRYFTDQGNHYLRYEEVFEGLEEPAVNAVKITPQMMEVRKCGAVNVQMIFQENKKTISCYETPYGPIRMGITTTSYHLHQEESRLFADVHYILEMNDIPTADCQLVIEAVAKNEKNGMFV